MKSYWFTNCTLVLIFLFIHPYMAKAALVSGGVSPDALAVIVNSDDADSMEVGRYYLSARGIPESNLIKVYLPTNSNVLKPEQFDPIRRQIMASLPDTIQAIVMIWTTPYAVGCNSITSAMSLGFDAKQCEKTCDPGKLNTYFDNNSRRPYRDFGFRPSMLLPITSVKEAKNLIDRGVISSFKVNPSTGYFLITSDKVRNARSQFFPKTGYLESKQLHFQTIEADSIQDKTDVMFYFTGQIQVANLASLNFMPGAVADHLTSFGGDLLGKGQMSSLRWIEAGATGSYGTVTEPCSYWQKFSNPLVLMKHYLNGETLIESYWKSVAWPAQGLFIGEPLAMPY